MNILLSLLLCTNVLILALLLIFAIKARKIYENVADVYAQITTFISPPDENTSSPLANVVTIFGDNIARSFVAQIKALWMGIQSGSKRATNANEADLAEVGLNMANPMLGQLLSALPGLRKLARKNPQLIDMALGAMGKTNVVDDAPSDGHSGQSNFII